MLPPAVAEAAKPAAPVASATQMVSGEKLSAPMPGVILQVSKSVGDRIKKGDVVFVMEAMKMECEIFAPGDGVIGQILTSKGTNVATG